MHPQNRNLTGKNAISRDMEIATVGVLHSSWACLLRRWRRLRLQGAGQAMADSAALMCGG